MSHDKHQNLNRLKTQLKCCEREIRGWKRLGMSTELMTQYQQENNQVREMIQQIESEIRQQQLQ